MTAPLIKIQTGARLHFGPLSFRPEQGRHFGGIGMMIRHPGYSVRVSVSDKDQITSWPSRTPEIINRIRENQPHWRHKLNVHVESVIPSHQGLGSGTQLAMALAEAVAVLHDCKEMTSNELALLCQRGERSSIGLHGYLSGGFLVDAGHATGEVISPLAAQFQFPDRWPILLITPPSAKGISGTAEVETFEQLASMAPEKTGELCRLALTEILPAVQIRDFEKFAQGLHDYGIFVGDFFRKHQGGVFSHPAIGELVHRLHEHGLKAIAQTSWGPTIAVFAENQPVMQETVALLQADDFGKACSVTETSALNHGRELHSSDEMLAAAD